MKITLLKNTLKPFFSRTGKLILSLSLLVALGLAAGITTGNHMIKGLISKGSLSLFLLYRPSSKYIETARLLRSNSETERLTGYYSLLENKKMDSDFLIKRYKKESLFIKRSIIWLLGFSGDKNISGFLAKEYIGATVNIKKEILRSIKKIDASFFDQFSKTLFADKKLLEDL